MAIINLGQHRAKAIVALRDLHAMRFKTADIQRDLDHERVKGIVHHQTLRHEAGHGLFFSGDVIVWDADGTYLVLDGQHRLEAMKRLVALDPGFEVSIDVLKSPPGLTIDLAFELINSGVPVPDYIKNASGAAKRRPILDRLGVLMNRHFGTFVSPSARPNVPNINVTQFLERVNDSKIIDEFETGDDLFLYVEWINERLRGTNAKVDAAAKKKAEAKTVTPLFVRADEDYEWLQDPSTVRQFRASYVMEDLMVF